MNKLAAVCLVLAIALGVGGVLWYQSDQRHGEIVQAYADSVRSAEARVDTLTGRLTALDSVWAVDSARWARRADSLHAEIVEARAEADEAGFAFDAVGDSLQETIALIGERFPAAEPLVDTALARLDRTVDQHHRQVSELDRIIQAQRHELAAQDTAMAMLRTQLAVRDTLVGSLREQARLQEATIRELKSRVQIGFLEKLFRDPVVKGLAFAGGVVTGLSASR